MDAENQEFVCTGERKTWSKLEGHRKLLAQAMVAACLLGTYALLIEVIPEDSTCAQGKATS